MENTYIVEKVKYDFLVNYLRAKVEKGEYIDTTELKRILIALELEDETNE